MNFVRTRRVSNKSSKNKVRNTDFTLRGLKIIN